MSKGGTIAAARDAPLFAWMGPLARFAEFGTEGYPRPVRRRLTIVNVMAFLIAIFSAGYAAVFAYYGAEKYFSLIVVNLLLVAVALAAPLAHRINDIAAAVIIAIAEFIALFFFVWALGRDSGIQINYIIAAAVAFAIYGLSNFRLVVAVIAVGLALHVAAWFLFPPERALIAADPGLLANLYVSSAVTTFGMIALIVGYAFTLADQARAEADALLANILPEAIAERLKERPGERVADSVAEASVCSAISSASPSLHSGLALRAPLRSSTRWSPSSTGSPRRMALRRSRPPAMAIWRWLA
jgi:adenylate cyclase